MEQILLLWKAEAIVGTSEWSICIKSDLKKVMALLRLRRQIKTYQIPLADLPVLFIGPWYQEEPEWRKEAWSN